MSFWCRASAAVVAGLVGLDFWNIASPPRLERCELKNKRIAFTPNKRAVVCRCYNDGDLVAYWEDELGKGERMVVSQTGGNTEIWAIPKTYILPTMFCIGSNPYYV